MLKQKQKPKISAAGEVVQRSVGVSYILKQCRGWRDDSTADKALVLRMTDPNSIAGILYAPPALPGVIDSLPEH